MKPSNNKNSLLAKFYESMDNNDCEDESSDDEDFVCDSDEIDNNSDESSTDENDDNDEEDDENNSENASSDETLKVENDSKPKITKKNSQNLLAECNKQEIKLPVKQVKHHNICCICLNQQSESFDELVSCDSCGFFTHEGCYGIADTESKSSTDSSASTEPWFCNSCLCEKKFEPNIADTNENDLKCFHNQCELCPNVECGLLKETDNGKFVHMVCALYTPGITYQNTDKLWPVVLNEIPSVRWGEQACSLCEDARLSRTGVCIQCDAGLCKTYFHVTCAQKYGLLVDPLQQAGNENDPFIAYCKQHNEKPLINARKTSYLAMVANYKSLKHSNERLFHTYSDRDRIEYKFTNLREKYEFSKQKAFRTLSNSNSIEPVHKVPRMITTCPSAIKSLLKKSASNNLDNNILINQQSHSSASITFTPDFVKYYFEREKRIANYLQEKFNLKLSQPNLTKQEHELRNMYEMKINERQNLIEKNVKLNEKLHQYIKLVSVLVPKYKVPESLLANRYREEKPDTSVETSTRPVQNGKPSKSLNNSKTEPKSETKTKRRSRKKLIESVDNLINLDLDAECCVCHKKTDSHLLVECDTCKNYYHINCLEPPLLAVPKKTKLYGWECSKCVRKKDSDYEDEESLNSSKLEMAQRSKRERKPKIRSPDIDVYVAKSKMNTQNKRRNRNENSKQGRPKKAQNGIKKFKSQHSRECSEADAIYIDDDEDDEDYDDYIDINDTSSSNTKQNSLKDAFSDESNDKKSNVSLSNKKSQSKNSDEFEKIIDNAILSTTKFGMPSPKKAKSFVPNL